MKTNKERIYELIRLYAAKDAESGLTTQSLAAALHISRSNVSSLLNELVTEKRLAKTEGRPVRYYLDSEEESPDEDCFPAWSARTIP